MQQRFMVTMENETRPHELAKQISELLPVKLFGIPPPSVRIIPEKAKYYQFKVSTTLIAIESKRLVILLQKKIDQLAEIEEVIKLISNNPLKRVTVNFEKKKETQVPCEWVLPALEDQKANVITSIAVFEKAIKDYLEGQIHVKE